MAPIFLSYLRIKKRVACLYGVNARWENVGRIREKLVEGSLASEPLKLLKPTGN